jgi:hypothetical protein
VAALRANLTRSAITQDVNAKRRAEPELASGAPQEKMAKQHLAAGMTESRAVGMRGWTSRPCRLPCATRPSIQPQLLYPRATALNQNDQHDDKKHAGDNPDNRDTIHFNSPFIQWLNNVLNDSDIRIIAGPRVTRKSEGKINSTSGKISLTDSFAAFSSICWTRWVLSVSE